MRIVWAAAAALALAGCAGAQSAGDSAALPPPTAAEAYEEAPAPQADVVAPGVSVAPPAAPAPREESRGDITVPGQVEQQVRPPRGDPRTAMERMEDIRAWDSCVMQVQGAAESNPLRPALDQPEEVCSRELGMSSRTAVPASRLERR